MIWRARRTAEVWRAAICGAGLAGAVGLSQAAPVGWVYGADGRTPPGPDLIRIARRGGVSVNGVELEPCDTVHLTEPRATALVKLVNGAQVWLRAGATTLNVPCTDAKLSFSDAFTRALKAFVPPNRGARDPLAIAATRGDDDLKILGLGDYQPKLVAGRRALFVAWSGGKAPFEVRLQVRGKGTALAEAQQVRSHSVDLSPIVLAPGAYVLKVRDANGVEVTDEDLVVVEAHKKPAMALASDTSGIDAVERRLLEVLFLEGQGDGEWRLEALQVMATLPRHDDRVRLWLTRFGVE